MTAAAGFLRSGLVPAIAVGAFGIAFAQEIEPEATTDEVVVEPGGDLFGVQPVNDEPVADSQPLDDVAGEIDRLERAIDSHQRVGRMDEALAAARELAGLIEDREGATLGLADTLMTVADLQLETGKRNAAEVTLTQVIALIERKDYVFSPLLVEPLSVLAGIYSTTGRRDDAVTALRRARHITHRNFGILNMEQIEIADALADNYYYLGKIGDANRENRFAFRVNEREYGADSAELVPAITKLAKWYERIGEFSVARRLHRRSIALIEKDYGPDDLRLVEVLRDFSDTFRRQNLYKNEGRNALRRAVEIHNQHEGVDVIDRARSMADLGDWLMVTAQRGEAMKVYRQAWNLLTADGASPENADIIFGKPKRLRYNPPLPDPSLMAGQNEIFVDVEFAVTRDGNVTNLSIADATAHWRIQNDVRVAMRHARFRPMFIDGEPARSPVRYRWTYRIPDYARTDAATAKPEGDAPEQAAND